VRETVLRTVSEALTNSARHAYAHHVWVQVVVENDVLCVTIRDDGVGFDRERVEGQSGHYGLMGLRERARLAGGELDITSTEGKATIVAMQLPTERLEITRPISNL